MIICGILMLEEMEGLAQIESKKRKENVGARRSEERRVGKEC